MKTSLSPKIGVSVVFVATMFMYILDSTVVNVALPTLRGISLSDTSHATTLTTVMRQAGSALGVALVATCLAALHPVPRDLTGYHVSFGIAAVAMAGGAGIGWRVRKADALAAMRPQADALPA